MGCTLACSLLVPTNKFELAGINNFSENARQAIGLDIYQARVGRIRFDRLHHARYSLKRTQRLCDTLGIETIKNLSEVFRENRCVFAPSHLSVLSLTPFDSGSVALYKFEQTLRRAVFSDTTASTLMRTLRLLDKPGVQERLDLAVDQIQKRRALAVAGGERELRAGRARS